MGTRHMDDAMRSFDGVLAEKPNNIVALLGKVCSFLCCAGALQLIISAGQNSLC